MVRVGIVVSSTRRVGDQKDDGYQNFGGFVVGFIKVDFAMKALLCNFLPDLNDGLALHPSGLNHALFWSQFADVPLMEPLYFIQTSSTLVMLLRKFRGILPELREIRDNYRTFVYPEKTNAEHFKRKRRQKHKAT